MHRIFTKKVNILLIYVALCATFYLTPDIAQAAVSIDNSSSATTGSQTQQTLSWSHTTGGIDRILVVGVSINTNTLVSSVTYSGVPLTKITALESGNALRVSLWYLVNPPTGSNTVAVTMSAAARFVAGAQSYTGVNQQTPFGSPVVSSGSGTSALLAIPSSVNEIVVDVIARRGDLLTNPISAGSEQTQRWNNRTTVNNNNNGVTGGSSTKVGNISTSMSWSWPQSRRWAAVAVSLKPAQASDITPPLRFNSQPSGTLSSGTSQTTMSLSTNENATCRYSNTPNTLYADMTDIFSMSGGTEHSQTLTELTDGSSYSFYVRCSDTAGNRNGDDFTISFSIAELPPPPPDSESPTTPQDFTADVISYSSINLFWSPSIDNVGIDGYKIFRDDAVLTIVSGIENSYVDSTVSQDTLYQYQILAFDVAGNESPRSPGVSVITPTQPQEPDTEAPTTPDNLVANPVSSSEIDLSWNTATDNVDVVAYRVYRNGMHIASVDELTYVDLGLDADTFYTYQVSAIDASLNESLLSDSVSATTFVLPPPPDLISPQLSNGLPNGILPSGTQSAILVVTTDENAICKYSSIPGVVFDVMENTFSTNDGSLHESQIAGLSDGGEYDFYVRCRDDAGNANSIDFTISFSIDTLIDTEPPTIPSNLQIVTITPTSVNFTWDISDDNVGVAGYKVFRDGDLIATTLDNEYTDFGLSEFNVYTYTVQAYDATGNESVQSSQLIITTAQSDNTAPVITEISASNITTSSAVISWQTDEPATSLVEYGFSTLYGAEVFDADYMTDHSLTLPNLSAGATYHFRVHSIDGSGNTALSLDQIFTTIYALDTELPATIADLSAMSVGPTFVNLSWTAPGDNGNIGQATSYDIRVSKNVINEANWDVAQELTGEPTPEIAETIQSYVAVGLDPVTTYYFAIRTTDATGNVSTLSNVLSVTTSATQTSSSSSSSSSSGGGGGFYDSTPPGTPSDFQATAGENQIYFQWKNPSDSDFVRVILIRKRDSAPTSWSDGEVIYEGDKEQFTDTGLEEGSEYYYGLVAYDYIPNYSQMVVINVEVGGETQQINISQSEIEAKTEEETKIEEQLRLSSSSTFQFLRSLYFGMRGLDISELQKILARNKSIYPQGIVSGFFGELTKSAVREFQCSYGIICFGSDTMTGYGRVGPITRAKLNELLIKNPDFVPQRTFDLSYGAQGNAVKALQEFLTKDVSIYPDGLVTGYFGELTRGAVQRFQCKHDIVCFGDEQTTGYGKVGLNTKKKINELSDK